jgi:hypothetical protein
MDLVTVGWIALGWFAVALIISFALGGFLRQTSVNMGETDLADGISKTKALRYIRGGKPNDGKPKIALASSSPRMPGKRTVG